MKTLIEYMNEDCTFSGGTATLMPNVGTDVITPPTNYAAPATTIGMGDTSDIGMLSIKKYIKRKLKKHNKLKK